MWVVIRSNPHPYHNRNHRRGLRQRRGPRPGRFLATGRGHSYNSVEIYLISRLCGSGEPVL